MNPLYAAALEIQAFCESRRWRFCIVGGLAVARWGRPRMTQDVDLELMADVEDVSPFVVPLLGRFRSREPDAARTAAALRVVLIEAANGVALDVILAALPYEDRAIGRASKFTFDEGVELLTASAEDLMVMKSFAGRGQDWVDVEGIAVRQGAALDWDLIESELRWLAAAAEQDPPLDRLAEVRRLAEAE